VRMHAGPVRPLTLVTQRGFTAGGEEGGAPFRARGTGDRGAEASVNPSNYPVPARQQSDQAVQRLG